MTYAWVQDLPIGVDVYDEITAGLGDQPPEGLIVHVAQVMDDGHLRYLDVWESEAACERFTEQRLHPVVGPVLARHQVQPDREPPRLPVHIADVWVGTAAVESRQNVRPQSATR
jgi:hypothetical protein